MYGGAVRAQGGMLMDCHGLFGQAVARPQPRRLSAPHVAYESPSSSGMESHAVDSLCQEVGTVAVESAGVS